MNLIKKGIFILLFAFLTASSCANVFGKAPSFNEDVASKLTETTDDASERVYQRDVDHKKTLKENFLQLFHPEGKNGGQIWDIVRKLLYSVIVLIFFYLGFLILWDAKEAKISEWSNHLMYVFVGAGFAFAGIRIINILNLSGNTGGSEEIVSSIENELLFEILKFLKATAFFAGVVFLIWHGYQMMNEVSKEEKLKKAKNGILVVIISLIFIKGIDYIYYIAQAPNMKQQATQLIVNVSKTLAYILGATFVVFMIYAGYKLVTDGGKGEGLKQFKKIATGIVLGAIVLFLFLFILYQVVQEFA